ncbi:DUF317 domain-containing protein [Actinacidiphila acididurans]|uniref:DUF317 domain-containing protein n=1 Tax=Actinacidiphila acididurans TaxID=2784346 RepID=A0ABS2TXF3_9ACTN|nr:DUF317 domain-containing protein [Actinacidiphila acididurans]MBM9508023.1 DUF317 domain-containing protein [Actinacidiphila acididurans]
MPYNADDEQWREYLVTPRYLAGSDGTGDVGFAPVAHWPHHHLDDGPCQLMVTSPDGRIRIGWFGDDYDLWKITSAEDAVSAPRWTATFNHVTPAEIVAGLTAALARDYANSTDDNHRFLAPPSLYWADAVQPLINVGWTRAAAERGTVELIAPDRLAGVLIDNRFSGWNDETVTLWAGPPGWGTRAEAVFTTRTPAHLIAATAAVMADPTPVIRERQQIDPRMQHLVTLTLVDPPPPQARRAPTPLDVRRAAVVHAVQRASGDSYTDVRVRAARIRTALSAENRPDRAGQPPGAAPSGSVPTPRHSR